ncbi:MAG: hypothetical protein GY683_02455 [Moraxella sp.]|nr:hypothetical protein [Moraxella sp.]
MDVNSRFVFNGQSWSKLNNTLMVADIAAMNALTIAQTGNIAKIAQVENGQPSSFIYSGKEWLPMNNTEAEHHTVANLAELNRLPAKAGDLVGVIDAGKGKYEHFFYADGEWKKQIRGGDAGTITITARDGIRLSSDSAITTESISAGGGGLIIKTDGLLRLTNSDVTTSVEKGFGQGGDMSVNANFVVLENGKIIARANEGDGGNMNITTTGIYRFGDESASPIDASSELGIDGVVTIDSPNENVTEGLLSSTTSLETKTFLKDPCEVHTWEEYINRSHFDIHLPIGGSPQSPYDLKPSRLSNTRDRANTKARKSSVIPEEQLF